MIRHGGHITRRKFLATSAVAGVSVFASSAKVDAIRFPIPLTQALEESLPKIGQLTYAQVHVTDKIALPSALGMLEFAVRGRRLDKVAALGDVEFETLPTNVMATLFMDRGLRCMVTSAKPITDRFAFFRGEEGSLVVLPDKVRRLDASGALADEPLLQAPIYDAESLTLPLVLQALRSRDAQQVSA